LPEVSASVVKINEDGTATVLTGAAEIGQGSDTVMAQIAADTLGLSFKDVQLVSGDTDRVPFDMGAYASRTTHTAGNSVMVAALDARKKLEREAARMLEADPADVEIRESRVWVKGAPDKSVSIKEVVEYATFGRRSSPRSKSTPKQARCGCCGWWRPMTWAGQSIRWRLRARSKGASISRPATR
jgi:CO/xanthine dehydrogenase Mo-binding subunit